MVFTQEASEEPPSSPPIQSKSDIAALDPFFFEAFVAYWFSLKGGHVYITPSTNDAGVDVLSISPESIDFIQVKHVSRPGKKIDPAAIQEIRNGADHYMSSVLPPALRSRPKKLWVVTNGKASSRFERDATEHDIRFVGGNELVREAKNSDVRQADISTIQAARSTSLQDLRSEIARLASD